MIRNEQGFTLIELMVVVLIIGILVAIAIPVFGSAATNAKNRSCQANLRTIDGAVAQYLAEYNQDPGTVQAMVTTKFLKEIPVDPHDGDQNGTYTLGADGNGSVKAIAVDGQTY